MSGDEIQYYDKLERLLYLSMKNLLPSSVSDLRNDLFLVPPMSQSYYVMVFLDVTRTLDDDKSSMVSVIGCFSKMEGNCRRCTIGYGRQSVVDTCV
eukprot:7771355-Ditylum_brightwellii.AAC.1